MRPLLLASFALAWPLSGLAANPLQDSPASSAQATQSDSPATKLPLFLRFPDVSATEIAFVYAGDLWIVPKEGGVARPLTSAPGPEMMPKFNPDGTQIAFMGDYDGGSDIYRVPTSGGVPVRLTYHPGREMLNEWAPDGQSLLFHSNRESGQARAAKVFRVSSDGGMPTPLPIPYGTFATENAEKPWLAYTPYSREFRTWKRYRGGLAQDIWLFDLSENKSKRITTDPGSDQLPMWHGSDLYFLSDRGDAGIPNLYRYNATDETTTAVTEFTTSGVRFPSIGPDDIVFEWNGALWRHEIGSGNTVQVPIEVPSDRPALRPVHRNLADEIENGSLSPNAKGIVFEARGDLFLYAVEEEVAENLTHSSGIAERFPEWSPDGTSIAFWSDQSGEYELYLLSPGNEPLEGADDSTGYRKLTDMGPGWKMAPAWSPDSKHLAFSTSDGRLYLVNVASGETNLVIHGPYADSIDIEFSPDSRWMTWELPHPTTNNSAVHLFDIENGTTHIVTSGMFDDTSPTFDQNGDWMYYLSARTFQPTYADLDETWIYRETREMVAVPLRSDVESPFAHKDTRKDWGKDPSEEPDDENSDDEGSGEEGSDKKDSDQKGSDGAAAPSSEGEDSSPPDSEDDSASAEKDEEPAKDILIDGFESRGRIIECEHQSLIGLLGLSGAVGFAEMPATGRAARGMGISMRSIELKPEAEPVDIISGIQWLSLSQDRTQAMVNNGSDWALIKMESKQSFDESLDLSGLQGVYDPMEEWPQMLRDTYRLYRDFFYDPGMHGVDWKGEYERYAALIPSATHREDLHYLIGEMIGELNVGHAYNRGGSESRRSGKPSPGVGLLGCDWELDQGAYRIGRILGTPYDIEETSPLSAPGVNASVGEYLLAVDGQDVDPTSSLHKALIGKSGRLVRLELNSTPTRDGQEREVTVMPMRSESALRYRTWVHETRQKVSELSNGRIGYVHVPDTGIRGQNELMRQFVSAHHADALIVDERWNGGGQIPWRFVELLDRPTLNYWATRGQKSWDYPSMQHAGPKAMLINGPSGSGGDCFPYYFRQKGLGPLIGTRTWGGLVGISGNPSLVDGSNTSIPTFGFYELDGTWGIENHGVDPDIEVIDDPALMLNGGDPQLEVAIQFLLRELESKPSSTPPRPTGPQRQGAGIPAEER